ncbi:MAG: orotidine 5'-phosphate decarboxylase [Pirellulaceae bacterium]|nr:MAG: orotidine 5'-phosphate decarboxylase [Pirellulaceae bacterium]
MDAEFEPFGDRLAAAVVEKQSVVCVGLDPRWEQLPEAWRDGVPAGDLVGQATRTARFCCEVVDAVASSAAVIKPQAAFFEMLGPPGMEALKTVIDHCHRRGLLVILDAKRGDIGSTAEGYARAYLGTHTPWQTDALTINPFLGDDTLRPFVDRAHASGSGLFVLVKTSNPGSGFLQDLVVDGKPVFERVAQCVHDLGSEQIGPRFGWTSIGAVVGATYPEQLAQLRQTMPRTWLLIPGYGAQGGSADDVAGAFDRRGLGAVVNSSRGIIFAYRQSASSHRDWQDAVAQAAETMRRALNAVRPIGS